MDWEMRLLEDTLAAGSALTLPEDGINRVVYVAHGGVDVGGSGFADDQAWHGRGGATLAAGPGGAALWRFEVAPAGSAPAQAAGGRTLAKLARTLPGLPAEALLLRGDSVAFPAGGCAFLHTHQGPGIRCLIEGGIRIDTEGRSTAYAPGGAWFEGGPEPVFAQAAPRPTRFVRVMLLPAALLGRPSISYVDEADRAKPKSQSYRGYVDAAVSL